LQPKEKSESGSTFKEGRGKKSGRESPSPNKKKRKKNNGDMSFLGKTSLKRGAP